MAALIIMAMVYNMAMINHSQKKSSTAGVSARDPVSEAVKLRTDLSDGTSG